jgi:hypothetical protein
LENKFTQRVIDETDCRVWPLSQWKKLSLFLQVQFDTLYDHSIPFAIRTTFTKGLEMNEEDEEDGDANDDDDDGGRKKKGKKGIKTTSTMSKDGLVLREVEAEDGENMKGICSRISTDYFPGCGYYQLLKKEKVSSDKVHLSKTFLHSSCDLFSSVFSSFYSSSSLSACSSSLVLRLPIPLPFLIFSSTKQGTSRLVREREERTL